MIGPDQDLSDFPRWIWPYIRVEQLVRARVFAAERALDDAPRELVLGHFTAIVQAIQLKTLAARIEGPVGTQMGKGASQAILDELDDWCGTKPRPRPHRAAELAAYLATFAASSNNEVLRNELSAVVEQIGGRLQNAAAA